MTQNKIISMTTVDHTMLFKYLIREKNNYSIKNYTEYKTGLFGL